MRIRLISLGILVAAVLLLAPSAWAAAPTFTVTTTTPAGGTCPGPSCSLGAAISAANAVAGGGLAPTIQFALGPLATITVTGGGLPAITRDGTFVDGCNVGRSTDGGLPTAPDSNPCVGLRGPGATPSGTGLTVTGADLAAIQGLAITNFARGVRLWGADNSGIGGNWFGLDVDADSESNAVGVSVTGRSSNGVQVDAAGSNRVGDASDGAFGACNGFCNIIVNSTVAGIDLDGDPTPASGLGDTPAGGPCRENPGYTCGTYVRGNWIGVASPDGTAVLPNATAILLGDSQDTMIGGDASSYGNVIAGNTKGVDQGAGTHVAWLIGGVYGLSPDGNTSVPNGQWNARLTGSAGLGSVVDKVAFGPATVGLQLDGPTAQVTGSAFFSPDGARFSTAAIRVGPGGDRAFIGSAADSETSPGCVALQNGCNQITGTATGAPGIWIDGADDVRIQRNTIGSPVGLFITPIDGPPIRIGGGSTGAKIGDDDDLPAARNVLIRTGYPAVDVGGGATKIVIGDNQGLAVGAFALPSGIFTDLTPAAGPGNAGPANNGIQPPTITQAGTDGVGGTATPGATIRVLQQQRKPVQGDPNPFSFDEGYTFPTSPSVTTADENGIWGITFSSGSTLKTGQKLLASQTTADGSSEYAIPQAAAAGNPPVLVTFTSGPTGVVATRSATFTFVANRVVKRFACSVDAGAFVPCSSPFTLNGLDIGGHQLQVRGIDPTGVAGNNASRTWIVHVDEPLAPQPPPGASAATLRFSSLVTLPSARRCISRRSLRITVRAPKGGKVKTAEVRIGGRRVGSARGATTIPVSLKGLPAGRFVVRVKVTLADRRVISGSRTYRTCAKKRARR